MQAPEADEFVVARSSQLTGKLQPIASWAHLLGFLGIMVGIAALGFYAQHAASAPGGQLAQHNKAIPVYLTAGLMDWALFYYCWVGVHRRGGNLETLSVGRWTSWRDVAIDAAIALPFWVVWEATAYAVHHVVGSSSAKSVASLLPQSLLEIVIWIAVSITAGFCEEIAFRGYLQRQFQAVSGNIAVAVIAQALVFGLAHGYQGFKQVIVISVLGVLYGAFAAWRRNLRANMIAHAWSDVWSGRLRMAV